MACWKQGEQEQAKSNYERAQQSMEQNRPGNIELIKLRAEASALLGLPVPSTSSQPAASQAAPAAAKQTPEEEP